MASLRRQIFLLALLESGFASGWQIRPTTAGSHAHRYQYGRSLATSMATASKESPQEPTVTKDGIFIVDAMPPPLPDPLHNSFYLLRHGQSWGNVEGVISSSRSLATSDEHGLTPLGYEQGRESAEKLLEMIERENGGGGDQKRRVFFYSSPFARARQTAQACIEGLEEEENKAKAEKLGVDIQTDITLEDGIMERFFGRLDFQAIHTYGYVWPIDMFNVTHTAFEVESVAAVATRIREVLTRIDGNPKHAKMEGGDIIVLASHADVCQIAQVYAAGAENVGTFSQYRFANGEVRPVKRTVDSLPDPVPLEPPKPGT